MSAASDEQGTGTRAVTPELLEVGAEPSGSTLARRRRVVAALGGVALLLVAGVALVDALHRTGAPAGVYQPPRAVTTTPAKAWTWTATTSVVQVVPDGGATYVTTVDDRLTALGRNGGERWSAEVPGAPYVRTSRGGVVLAHGGDEGSWRTCALAARSGKRLWEADAALLGVGDDFVVLKDDRSVWRVDLRTGEKAWEAAGAEASAVGDDVVLRRDDTLVVLAAGNGEERWAVEMEHPPTDDDPLQLVIADGFVAAADDRGAQAFDLDDGHTLWTTDPADVGTNIGLASADRVYLAGEGLETTDQVVAIYDRTGRVTSFRSGTEAFFGEAFTSGGHHYLRDYFGDAVYDTDSHRRTGLAVGAESGRGATLADGGYYTVLDGELRFYEYGARAPRWTLPGDFRGDDLALTAGDEQVLVTEGAAVTAYR